MLKIPKPVEWESEWIYSVSHDLRAPLRSIDGFSNKILKDYNNLLDDQGKDYFNRVMNASRHMGHLIDDLIKLARISRIDMNMQEINLSGMAGSIISELKESNPEREASIYIQDNMIVTGDRNLMHIALNNLLGNLLKTMEQVSICGTLINCLELFSVFTAFPNLKVPVLVWQLYSELFVGTREQFGQKVKLTKEPHSFSQFKTRK